MKRRGRHRLRWLSAVSLIVFGGSLILWPRSGGVESEFIHFSTSAGRYTVQSFQGELALLGPARQRIDDSALQALARNMSERDFDWQPPVERNGRWFVRGIVRQGTPTLALFNRFHENPSDPLEPDRAQRMWLAALDDPERFIPANMMLLFLAQRWREANVDLDTRIPYVVMPAANGQSRPDLSHNSEIKRDWHQRLDRHRLVVVWYAWPMLASSLILFAIFTRPRGEFWTMRCWSFNATALFSFLLLIALAVCWIRSYDVQDTWNFTSRTALITPLPVAWTQQHPNSKTRLRMIVQVSRGRIFESDQDEVVSGGATGPRLRYLREAPRRAFSDGSLLGFLYGSSPAQMYTPSVNRNAYPGDRQMIVGSAVVVPRYREVSIPFWLLATIAAGLPALWARKILRDRKRGRANERLCPVCSYDLRASADRCPECGTEVRSSSGNC